MAKTYAWHKIAESEAEILLEDNRISIIEVRNKKICLTKFRDQWFGFTYTCPHAGGSLGYGHIDAAGNVVCPLHRYRFNIRNGYNASGEGFYLRTYPVQLRDDGMYVGL